MKDFTVLGDLLPEGVLSSQPQALRRLLVIPNIRLTYPEILRLIKVLTIIVLLAI